MNRRIILNVAFFALLGGVLAVWAATSLLKLDVIARPFPVTAEFASSPGLFPDLQVSYLGVPVGRVASVKLEPGKVAVRMEIDHDAKIPAGAGARVLRKSAIGEPYVELTAPAQPADGVLKAGDTVPLSRTSGTIDYQKLFSGLGDALASVNPKDASVVVHELAVGLNGRADTLRDLIGDADQLTATLAANSGLLNELSVQLTDVSGTLAAHRLQLKGAAADIADVTAEVHATDADLRTVLEQGPGFLDQVDKLLGKSRISLDCLLAAGATPGPSIFNDQTAATLAHVLKLIPTFQALIKDTAVVTPKATYLRATALVSIAGPKAAADYTEPVAKPTYTAPPRCVATPGSGSGKTKPADDAPDGGTAPAKNTPDDSVFVTARPVASDHGKAPGLLPVLPIVAAALILAAVAFRSARTYLAGRRARR